MTPEEARSILEKISGPRYKQLAGEEYDHVRLLLEFIEPCYSSNSQHSITYVYQHADKVYRVSYFLDETTPLIEEKES